MQITRLARILTLLGLLLSGAATSLAAARAAGAAPAEQCFPPTGFCTQGRFLAYWQQHGGLASNGYPLTAERRERLEDGNTYTVQYFERVRLELHPESMPPYNVLLGQFGRRIHPADPPVAPADGTAYSAVYFEQTGHNFADKSRDKRAILIGIGFRTYWEQHGGLPQFGYPISEPFDELLEDNAIHTVQYFERARFEVHCVRTEPARIDCSILLGQLGRRILTEVDAGR